MSEREQIVAWLRGVDHNFPLTIARVVADDIERGAHLSASPPAKPAPADGMPWHSVKTVPRSTMGYGGGTMLLDKDGACIGYVVTLNKSENCDPVALDSAVFHALSTAQGEGA